MFSLLGYPLVNSPTIEMSKPKDSSIPSWQRAASSKEEEKSPKPEQEPEHADTEAAIDDPEAMLLASKHVDKMSEAPTREQAAKFLEHPGVKAAELEDK